MYNLIETQQRYRLVLVFHKDHSCLGHMGRHVIKYLTSFINLVRVLLFLSPVKKNPKILTLLDILSQISIMIVRMGEINIAKPPEI